MRLVERRSFKPQRPTAAIAANVAAQRSVSQDATSSTARNQGPLDVLDHPVPRFPPVGLAQGSSAPDLAKAHHQNDRGN